jgi:hypothetical protein
MHLHVVQVSPHHGSVRTVRRPGHSLFPADLLALQRTIGNQAVGRLLRQGAPASAAVQRTVRWAELQKTETNHLYGISEQGAPMLVSTEDAPAPKPVGLYTHGADKTDTGGTVATWVPNVRFMQKGQMAEPGKADGKEKEKEKEKEGEPFGEEGLAEWQKDALARIAKYEDALHTALQGSLGKNAPTLGILGLNDCEAWAHKLRRLIADEELKGGRLFRPEKATESAGYDLGTAPTKVPPVAVGDTMVQKLFGGGSEYHGATVVASDSRTIVTLEGHVEKQLEAPVFHFYDGGLPAFVDANNEGEKYREANKVGVGYVAHLEAPTMKFYNELLYAVQYYEELVKEHPDDFTGQIRVLSNFKEIVNKPTVTVKAEGSKDTCLVQ